MKNKASVEWLVFGMLVCVGAGCRIFLRDWPNFAPVAAISLFAGYSFQSRMRAAVLAPSIMLLSDSVIGFYRLPLMLTVYGMLTLPIVAGWLLRNVFRFDSPNTVAAIRSFVGLTASSLLASVLFFLATNFMCWWGSNAYTQDWSGLVRCYTAAIPFFRNTLGGDLVYSFVLFGTYGMLSLHYPRTISHGMLAVR